MRAAGAKISNSLRADIVETIFNRKAASNLARCADEVLLLQPVFSLSPLLARGAILFCEFIMAHTPREAMCLAIHSSISASIQTTVMMLKWIVFGKSLADIKA